MRLTLVYFLIFLVSLTSNGQINNLSFSHISLEDGLSHNAVTCITQDNEGYIWLGTRSGLNKFNGYEITLFEHDPENKNTLSHNRINCMYQDNSGDFWIGTRRGLNKFNPETNVFSSFLPTLKNAGTFKENSISSLYEDNSGTLWIGSNLGLVKFNKETKSYNLYQHEKDHLETLKENAIHCIYEDKKGNLWVGTSKGLSLFDKKNGTFFRVSLSNDSSKLIPLKNTAKAIVGDESGKLWIATTGDGLKEFNPDNYSFKSYKNNPKDRESISSNNILSLYRDSFGAVWIGTRGFGLNKFDKTTGKFTRYLKDLTDSKSLNDNTILSIFEDKSKVLWFGTFLGGVNKYDQVGNKIEHFVPERFSTFSSLSDNYILSVCESRSGVVWVGNSNGIYKVDRKNKQAKFYSISTVFPEGSGFNVPLIIYEDKLGKLWIGLEGGGLQKFDPQTEKFTRFYHDPKQTNSLPSNVVTSILQDQNGVLWIGTHNGICSLDFVTSKFKVYSLPRKRADRIIINSIMEDSSQNLWFSTTHHGVYKFSPDQNLFTPFLQEKSEIILDGKRITGAFMDKSAIMWLRCSDSEIRKFNTRTLTLSTLKTSKKLVKSAIVGITEDAKGNVWFSTSRNGLFKYNPNDNSISSFDASDGFLGNEFTNAVCKSNKGELFFGGRNGLNIFHPDSIRTNPYLPPVVISSFKVFDKPRPFTKEGIRLAHNDNYFSFEFAALSYALPDENKYAYKLEGVDKEWVESGKRRFASYTNLDPGNYTFKVKGSNHDGVWNNKSTTIDIEITPPWWKTTLAYILFGLLFFGSIYGVIHFALGRQRLNHSLKLQGIESQRLQELDQLKTRFFTNISHEFRTPLTLIISPIQKIIQNEKLQENQKKEYYHLIHRNAERLLNLINQLLDLSKLELKAVQLEVSSGNIVQFVETLVNAFYPPADSKGVIIKFSKSIEAFWTFFDKDKVEKIVANLLSNALKFTPAGGLIEVTVSRQPIENEEEIIVITVRDSGIGIPDAYVNKIFDRFYQVDNSCSRSYEGAGIGLALTKELVDLHQGKIIVSSEEGKGTAFTVQLPFKEINPEATDRLLLYSSLAQNLDEVNANLLAGPNDYDNSVSQLGEKYPLLLIIEDNADLRKYIKTSFVEGYKILEAGDGEEGIKMAVEEIPDIIISDLMMPKVDGFEVCKRLKSNEKTSHIPIVLLTARATFKSKIECLEAGVNDYITKPFHSEELRLRIRNQIEQRNKLREKIGRQILCSPLKEEVTSSDNRFLGRVMEVIETHYSDPLFGVSYLEKEVGMSRVHLYRKLKALIDQAPTDLLRNFRLQKAASLISQGFGNVSEVAYKVGFNNPSYFTQCFREKYGVTPSQYQEKVNREVG